MQYNMSLYNEKYVIFLNTVNFPTICGASCFRHIKFMTFDSYSLQENCVEMRKCNVKV